MAPSNLIKTTQNHCTLAVMRALTRPPLNPPTVDELKEVLLTPWNVRVPIDPEDYTTRHHWKVQAHTDLFRSMMDWEPKPGTPTASLHPYFSFGQTFSPFFAPWQDVGNGLRNLLLHQVGCRQSCQFMALISHDTYLFVATSHNFPESLLESFNCGVAGSYLLRCHYDSIRRLLQFGYHTEDEDDKQSFRTFHKLIELSLKEDDNWRLRACIVLKNLARILNCLKDYTVPLVWSHSTKLSIVRGNKLSLVDDAACIQKIYTSNSICSIPNATVTNMMEIYQALGQAKVPHTDRLVAAQQVHSDQRICKFAPIGRSYLPENLDELLQALICVAQALVVLHSLQIMHRDIRWANVFHALDGSKFSKEWVLFDFEFAAMAPQPAFAAHTLTVGNHAPEMVDTDEKHNTQQHDTAVDIWGLGYLIQHAHVDVPSSHAADLHRLQTQCLLADPSKRPNAPECLEALRNLNARPRSGEKTVAEIA